MEMQLKTVVTMVSLWLLHTVSSPLLILLAGLNPRLCFSRAPGLRRRTDRNTLVSFRPRGWQPLAAVPSHSPTGRCLLCPPDPHPNPSPSPTHPSTCLLLHQSPSLIRPHRSTSLSPLPPNLLPSVPLWNPCLWVPHPNLHFFPHLNLTPSPLHPNHPHRSPHINRGVWWPLLSTRSLLITQRKAVETQMKSHCTSTVLNRERWVIVFIHVAALYLVF